MSFQIQDHFGLDIADINEKGFEDQAGQDHGVPQAHELAIQRT
ncbi:hypothetical protein ODD08_004524 [Salmonella enterica]|nr:hypothetical protein [Salmonella enterica subsp. enterica serovar Florian]EJX0634414.1 hypothetical protein [Salmonella enterica]